MKKKPKIMISFKKGGENGGPFVSHKRIMNSKLNEKYDFRPLYIPKGRAGIFNIRFLFQIILEIKKINPDIVHFSGLQLEGFYIALACKLGMTKKTILAIRGSSMESITFPKWKKYILNKLEIFTIKNSYVSYSVSEYVNSWNRIKDYSPWNYGHIYNLSESQKPVKHTNKTLKNNSVRDELGISKDTIIITSTGRITKEKGFEILSKIIFKMKLHQNIKFLIVGDGDFLDTFKKEVNNKKLEDFVYFLGYRNDVEQILLESDIFIICTLHETLCNSVIEACRYSLPVIATNVGGIPEIIKNLHSGFLVDIGDVDDFIKALMILINDPDKRKEMGKNGYDIIQEKFSTQKIISQLDSLYQEVLNKS